MIKTRVLENLSLCPGISTKLSFKNSISGGGTEVLMKWGMCEGERERSVNKLGIFEGARRRHEGGRSAREEWGKCEGARRSVKGL